MTSVHSAAIVVFWVCAFLIAYTYFIYPLVLFFAYAASQVRRDWNFLTHGRRDRRVALPGWQALPAISIVVPAYNEEEWLDAKLANLRELEYPLEKLEVILVSDGSTDRTGEILSAIHDARFRVLLLPKRGGKANALNHAVGVARNRILVFSDASTMIAPASLQTIVRHSKALRSRGRPRASIGNMRVCCG